MKFGGDFIIINLPLENKNKKIYKFITGIIKCNFTFEIDIFKKYNSLADWRWQTINCVNLSKY